MQYSYNEPTIIRIGRTIIFNFGSKLNEYDNKVTNQPKGAYQRIRNTKLFSPPKYDFTTFEYESPVLNIYRKANFYQTSKG